MLNDTSNSNNNNNIDIESNYHTTATRATTASTKALAAYAAAIHCSQRFGFTTAPRGATSLFLLLSRAKRIVDRQTDGQAVSQRASPGWLTATTNGARALARTHAQLNAQAHRQPGFRAARACVLSHGSARGGELWLFLGHTKIF